MRKLVLLLIASSFLIMTHAQQFTLVKAGKSNCRIIIPDKASLVEIQSSKVFQDYVERVSGAIIPIESDNVKPEDGEVLIGNVDRPEMKDVQVDKLEKDGFLIRNTLKKLIIAGGTEKGLIYGVYTFIEKYLGCRMYTATFTVVPKQKTITLNSINDQEVPAFAQRFSRYPKIGKGEREFMVWHKLDSRDDVGVPNSGSEWGSWVHTFSTLLSPKEYGVSHPEYFSFYNGERHPGADAQLCLSNTEVLEIVCKNLQALIAQNPGAKYWSVSQNDNVNYCRCPECAAIDAKYAAFAPGTKLYGHLGSKQRYAPVGAGSLLTFVNKVAERFPDKVISTLAYQYTRVPPKNLIPAKNVNIMLCSIESPRNVTLQEGDIPFSEDLTGWTKLTTNIILWDYIVQFRNLISPFPNLHTLQPNLQFLHNNGVQNVYEQGNPETGGEFHELKSYLVAKLEWDPDLDVNKTIDDFLTGYYGSASKMIHEYIDLLQSSLIKSGKELIIFGGPAEPDEKDTFLSDSLVTVYNKIFDRAEKAVSGSPDYLLHVRVARLPLNYAMLEIARSEKTGKRGAFIETADKKLKPNPEIVKKLYDFAYLCMRTDVSHVRERRITPQEYQEGYVKFLVDNTTN